MNINWSLESSGRAFNGLSLVCRYDQVGNHHTFNHITAALGS